MGLSAAAMVLRTRPRREHRAAQWPPGFFMSRNGPGLASWTFCGSLGFARAAVVVMDDQLGGDRQDEKRGQEVALPCLEYRVLARGRGSPQCLRPRRTPVSPGPGLGLHPRG